MCETVKFELSFKKGIPKSEKIISVSTLEEAIISEKILQSNLNISESGLPENIKIWHESTDFLKIKNNPKLSVIDVKSIQKILEKINLSSLLDWNNIYQIEKALVHKNLKENVMIRQFPEIADCQIYSFLGNSSLTPEIMLDHVHKDHVEAIIISEICRQAVAATAEEYLEKDTQFFISEEFKKYYRPVLRDKDMLVQVIPVGKNSSIGLCVFTIIQNNQLCLSGYLLGYIRGEKNEKY
ncbi:MAG: hypothetical protein LBI13_01400 [Streptococcaceae bacterium]|jgi:hypothetical protein|nr:hypothetical protein [Streptococcaceae bacterium]